MATYDFSIISVLGYWTAQPDLDRQMSVVVCRRRLSAVSKTADIMTLSVSFRYGKWVVPLLLLLLLLILLILLMLLLCSFICAEVH